MLLEGVPQGVFAHDAVFAFGGQGNGQAFFDGLVQRHVFAVVKIGHFAHQPHGVPPLLLGGLQFGQQALPFAVEGLDAVDARLGGFGGEVRHGCLRCLLILAAGAPGVRVDYI